MTVKAKVKPDCKHNLVTVVGVAFVKTEWTRVSMGDMAEQKILNSGYLEATKLVDVKPVVKNKPKKTKRPRPVKNVTDTVKTS